MHDKAFIVKPLFQLCLLHSQEIYTVKFITIAAALISKRRNFKNLVKQFLLVFLLTAEQKRKTQILFTVNIREKLGEKSYFDFVSSQTAKQAVFIK